jgi:Transcriptional Coactivator p15 (PC4)
MILVEQSGTSGFVQASVAIRTIRPTPALADPVVIAEWWKNRRGESVRLVLNRFEGRDIFDLRTWYTADGKLKPGKGFAAEVRHLPRLAAAFVKAEAKARELGLVEDKGAGDE